MQRTDLGSYEGLAVIEEEGSFEPLNEDVQDLIRKAKFVKRVRQADLNNVEIFGELITDGMELAGLLDQDLAEEFGCGLGTIVRWSEGQAMPASAGMRKTVIRWIQERVLER